VLVKNGEAITVLGQIESSEESLKQPSLCLTFWILNSIYFWRPCVATTLEKSGYGQYLKNIYKKISK